MKPQDELWWACLDGEITPAEAAQYDRTLSDEDHRLMAAEMEMERRLGEVLSCPAPDGDAAWRSALARVKAQEQARCGASRWRRRLVLAAVPAAVAAVALVVLGVGYARTEPPKPWFLSMSARDADGPTSAAREQEVMATARTMLHDRDMHMAFDPMNSLEAADAPYRLVSVRRAEHAGEPIVEMVFICGGKPAKVIITRDGGHAAREIGQATARGAALASRSVGDWLVTAVGVDAPERLLSLIEEAQPEPQGQSTPAAETPQMEMFVPESVVAVPEIAVAVPEIAVAAPEIAVAVPDTTVAVPDTAVMVPDSAVVPPDTAAVPPDSAVVPPDTAVTAPQSAPNAGGGETRTGQDHGVIPSPA